MNPKIVATSSTTTTTATEKPSGGDPTNYCSIMHSSGPIILGATEKPSDDDYVTQLFLKVGYSLKKEVLLFLVRELGSATECRGNQIDDSTSTSELAKMIKNHHQLLQIKLQWFTNATPAIIAAVSFILECK
ncbi:hypothetical protein Glove_74g33 [Diversispora epigaea]|uniref:Uncharacterized protein n=1 Tax=Diversispora epigaea TaxID=1348612 RepID=A0A397JCS5_9GLOM|nr:hypothetical protein Glove_74g33 [Diversispora epigaea]